MQAESARQCRSGRRSYSHAINSRPDWICTHGVSYGTYWAHRYLQLFPDQPAGVILDSIFPSVGQDFDDFDLQFDGGAQKLAELCKTDALCASKLGSDPWATLQSIAAKMRSGYCPELRLDLAERRAALGVWLQIRQFAALSLAAFYRFDRCAPEDVSAVDRLVRSADMFDAVADPSFSQVLYRNIVFSELSSGTLPGATLEQRLDDALYPALQATLWRERGAWPKYVPDSFFQQWAGGTAPVLMLGGTLDVQTPLESSRAAGAHLTGARRTFVEFPGGNHSSVDQTPVFPAGEPCGFSVAKSFVADPTGVLDTSCLSSLSQFDFVGDASFAQQFMGTNDIWENGVTAAASSTSVDVAAELERARGHVWFRAQR